MRPAERAALRDLEHPLERDRVPERVQLLDHELDAAAAVLAQPAQPVLERRVRRIDEIAEDMDVAPLGLGIQLCRWDHTHAERGALCDGLPHPEERVVVGERLDPDPARRGHADQLAWLVRAV